MGTVRETYSTLKIIIFDHYNADYYKMVTMLIRSLAHVVRSSGGRWVGWPGQGLKVRFGKDHDDYDHTHESPRDGHDHECWPGQGLKVWPGH